MNTTKTSSKKLKDGKHFGFETCWKTFKYKSALATHIGVHTGEKPFSLNICDKSFVRKGDLTKHKLTHFGQKIYQRGVCKRFLHKKVIWNIM